MNGHLKHWMVNLSLKKIDLRIGDDLETSGWGATIGGTLGGIGGAIGGVFTSPSLVVNPLTLGAAGSAAGSALGEGIEQYLTGKGDYGDVGFAGVEGCCLRVDSWCWWSSFQSSFKSRTW